MKINNNIFIKTRTRLSPFERTSLACRSPPRTPPQTPPLPTPPTTPTHPHFSPTPKFTNPQKRRKIIFPRNSQSNFLKTFTFSQIHQYFLNYHFSSDFNFIWFPNFANFLFLILCWFWGDNLPTSFSAPPLPHHTQPLPASQYTPDHKSTQYRQSSESWTNSPHPSHS